MQLHRPLNKLLLSLTLVLVASVPSWATDPYGSTSKDVGNRKIYARVAVPGVTQAGSKITGTKVEVTNETQVLDIPNAPNTYADVQLWKYKVTVNGETIVEEEFGSSSGGGGSNSFAGGGMNSLLFDPEPGGGGLGQANSPKGFRFASTHFSHDSTVTISLVAHFKFYNAAGTQVHTDSITATVAPKAYNYCFGMSTVVNSQGSVSNYGDTYTWEYNAQLIITKAYEKFGGPSEDMKHRTDPSVSVGKSLSESQVYDYLKVATVAVSAAHGINDPGNNSGLWPPDGTPGAKMEWGEVLDATLLSPVGYNLALIYSCSTFITSDANITSVMAFRVDQGANKAYAGFPHTVYSMVKAGDETDVVAGIHDSLSLHAQKVSELLLSGKTIAFSIAEANRLYMPRTLAGTGGYAKMPMEIANDGFTRLKLVYLSGSEREALLNNNRAGDIEKWYYIY